MGQHGEELEPLPSPASYDREHGVVKIADKEIRIGGPKPKLREGEKLLRETQSLCPVCYRLLPAIVFERNGKVYIRKVCPEHGEVEELYFGDVKLYHRFAYWERKPRGTRYVYVKLTAPCPFNCGLCQIHLQHTALANIVLTNRCDIKCWYCIPGDHEILIRKDGILSLVKLKDLEKYASQWNIVEINGIKGEYSDVSQANIEVLSFINGRATWVRVIKLFRRQYKGKVIEITTRSGRKILLTPEHRVPVYLESRKLKFKEARALSIGDHVLVIYRLPTIGRVIDKINLMNELRALPKNIQEKIYVRGVNSIDRVINAIKAKYYNKSHYWRNNKILPLSVFYEHLSSLNDIDLKGCYLGLDATKHQIPVIFELSPTWGKLIGYFISDGNYSYKDMRITASKDNIRSEITKLINEIGLPHSMLKAKGKAPQIVIGSRLFKTISERVFAIPPRSPHKRLPKYFLNLPMETKLALLAGLINGDGFIERGPKHIRLGYATTSEGLVRDLIYLFASLGIFVRIKKWSKERFKLAKHDVYLILLKGKDLEKTISLIREMLREDYVKKLYDVKISFKRRGKRIGDFVVDEIVSIAVKEYDGIVYDIEVDSISHTFVVHDGIVVSNCFFFAERAGYVYEPSIDQLRFMVRQLRKQGVTMAVQLTGGEPLLRNDLVDIVKMLKEEGVRHVQLNTNGLRIAEMMLENPEKAIGFVRELRQSGVNTVYLSFDGVSPEVNFKNHWEIPFIFEAFRQGNMKSVVLVPTVMKSYNDHELGDIIRFAAYNMDIVRGVNFQPVSLTGQMRKQEREKYRITIPDAIKKIEEQTDGQIHRDAWYPVPITVPISRFIEAATGEFKFEMANHPHCGTATYVYVERKNGKPFRFIPVTDFIDVDGLMEYLEQKAEELRSVKSKTIRYLKALKVISKLKSFIDESKAPKEVNVWKMIFNIFVKRNYKALGEWHYNFLFLGMMHFMDLYNYDVQRVMRCNIHYLTPDGRIIPFCTFNVLNDLYRDFIQKQYKIPLDEWVKKHGEFKTYKRDVKRLESHELYRKTYEEFLK